MDGGGGGAPVAAALAAATGAQTDRAGRIMVEKDLTIPGHPEISVLGDMMSLDKLPGVAEVAMQTGLYGHRIRHRAEGNLAESRSATTTLAPRPTSRVARPWSPRGRQDGRFPRLGHLALHSHRVPDRFPNRVGALLTWWLTFGRNLRRERTFTTQHLETQDIYTLPPAGTGPPAGAQPPADPAGVTAGEQAARPQP